MQKQILILNGSPRKNGNTAMLINSFIQGIKNTDKNYLINIFNLQQMNIHPCLGCLKGGKNKTTPCVQKDDMDKIYPVYDSADIVILASPLYYWNISGQLKCTFDRLFAIAECNENYQNPKKECILLTVAEGYDFEEVNYWYDRLLTHLNWINKGKIFCGGVLNIGDIKNKKELIDAYLLGNNL